MSIANNLYIQAERCLNTSALQQLESLGNTGNAEAMYLLGILYQSKIYQDLSQSAHWYLECAKRWSSYKHQFNPVEQLISLSQQRQPNSDVLNGLGVCYEYGYAINPDTKTATMLYQQSAELGNDIAMCNLGLAYKRGKGVDTDFNQASFWFKKSAAKQTNNPTGSLLATKQLTELMLPHANQLKEVLKNIEKKIESEQWMVKTFLNNWSSGIPSGMKQIRRLIKQTDMNDAKKIFSTMDSILAILDEKLRKSERRHYLTSQSYTEFHVALLKLRDYRVTKNSEYKI